MPKPAIVLIAHGSPDPDWRRPLEAIRDRLRSLAPDRAVKLCYQEFNAPSLETVACELSRAGVTQAIVLGAFVSAGGRHLKHDIPQLVRTVHAAHPQIELTWNGLALGSDELVIMAMAEAALRAADA